MDSNYSLKISQIAKKYGGQDEFIQTFFEASANSSYEFEYLPPPKWLYIPLFHRMGNSINYYFRLTAKYDDRATFNEIRRTNALKGVVPFPLYTPVKSKVVWKIENTDLSNSHTFDTVEQGILIPIKNERAFFAELRGEFLLLANIDANIKQLGKILSKANGHSDESISVSVNMEDFIQRDKSEGYASDDRYSATRNAQKVNSVVARDGEIYAKKKKKKTFVDI